MREGEEIALAYSCYHGLSGNDSRVITVGYTYNSAETFVRRVHRTNATLTDGIWNLSKLDQGASLAAQEKDTAKKYLFWDKSPSWYFAGDAPTVEEAEDLVFDQLVPAGEQLPIIDVDGS